MVYEFAAGGVFFRDSSALVCGESNQYQETKLLREFPSKTSGLSSPMKYTILEPVSRKKRNYSPQCLKEGYSKAIKNPKGCGDSVGSTR
jgi:hypothetical protein